MAPSTKAETDARMDARATRRSRNVFLGSCCGLRLPFRDDVRGVVSSALANREREDDLRGPPLLPVDDGRRCLPDDDGVEDESPIAAYMLECPFAVLWLPLPLYMVTNY